MRRAVGDTLAWRGTDGRCPNGFSWPERLIQTSGVGAVSARDSVARVDIDERGIGGHGEIGSALARRQ